MLVLRLAWSLRTAEVEAAANRAVGLDDDAPDLDALSEGVLDVSQFAHDLVAIHRPPQ